MYDRFMWNDGHPEEIISEAFRRARTRDDEHNREAYRLYGRTYHERSLSFGTMAFSDVITVDVGLPLYLRAAEGLTGVSVKPDPTGELSRRMREARNLPKNFMITLVEGALPDSPMFDRFDEWMDPAIDLNDDNGIVPLPAITPGTLTERAVYGLPGPLESKSF